MARLTLDIDADTVARAQALAAVDKLSLSDWVTKLIKQHVSTVDQNGYSIGFFESIAADVGLWDDFPSQDQIRRDMGNDLPRERL